LFGESKIIQRKHCVFHSVMPCGARSDRSYVIEATERFGPLSPKDGEPRQSRRAHSPPCRQKGQLLLCRPELLPSTPMCGAPHFETKRTPPVPCAVGRGALSQCSISAFRYEADPWIR